MAGPPCVPSPRHLCPRAHRFLVPVSPADGLVTISSVASSLSPSKFPRVAEAYHTANSSRLREPRRLTTILSGFASKVVDSDGCAV